MAHRVLKIDWTKAKSEKVEVGDTVEIRSDAAGLFTYHFPDDVPYVESAEEAHTRKVLGKRSPNGFSFAVAAHARNRKFQVNCFQDGKQVLLPDGAGNAQLQIGVGPDD